MTNERANELFREYRRTGDKAIRNELIENYMYVAQILAKKFAGRGVDYDDLLQIASEALISGVEKFDPNLGYMFTTYVTPTITGIIRNYFRDYSRSVRVPRKLYALSAKVKSAVNEFYKANGVKPT
ncbi:MAG: sigma-70 family RNA polymerase sigma factor, partial [Clostridia bacterium]|nr:sigma-70 family RNA polymerase sigma factor [Clostridia bacterium]